MAEIFSGFKGFPHITSTLCIHNKWYLDCFYCASVAFKTSDNCSNITLLYYIVRAIIVESKWKLKCLRLPISSNSSTWFYTSVGANISKQGTVFIAK